MEANRGRNTDGDRTYRDDVTKDEMARACMQNYDLEFADIARSGDILVSGYNFGTGASFLSFNHLLASVPCF